LIKYKILITGKAQKDIEDIYDYIAKQDIPENAAYFLNKHEELIMSLEERPERGLYPEELSRQCIKDYKEVLFKPYRASYEIIGSKVVVYLCVDGRRDMSTLLERRLLR